MRFLVLHAYSAENAGDGLLVMETLELLDETYPGADIDVLALYPDSFDGVKAGILNGSARSLTGLVSQYRVCRNLRSYDLVVGVGGGYLRAGNFVELMKTTVAHGIQLYLASRAQEVPVAYLPQSVGPLFFASRWPVTQWFTRIDRVYVRDDRSFREIEKAKPIRMPDLALLSRTYTTHSNVEPHSVPVLSIREIDGSVPPSVLKTAHLLSEYDGFIQSRGSGNDDVSAMAMLEPARMLDRNELLMDSGPRRVVIAVRLHAALMALNAGHWVIHLAYERKGYGAFGDLGLGDFVHNVKSFDPRAVIEQANELLHNPGARASYASSVAEARRRLSVNRFKLISDLKSLIDN